MAKILVIDDNQTNRKVLVALLEHEGHQIFEACDGVDGLAAVRSSRPNLAISDILMPTMDGYEFVRRLRQDPLTTAMPVIFYTAYYHEREAHNLARVCGVERVISKPARSTEILSAVHEVLARNTTASSATTTAATSADEGFDREHLRLLTTKLSESVGELRTTNARLAALTDLNTQLASERDPRALLEKVCHAARELIGGRYAVLAVQEPSNRATSHFSLSGLGSGDAWEPPRVEAGKLGTVFSERRLLRLCEAEGYVTQTGLPEGYPPAHAFLAAPICSLSRTYGWICIADKVGAAGFSMDDERILSTLGAQVGRIYENGSLYREVEQHAARLLKEMERRELAAAELRESEARFREMAETIQDVFFLTQPDFSQTLYLSPAYERIWGRTVASAYAAPLSWTAAIHPEDLERMRLETGRDAGGSDKRSFEFRIVRPDGSIRWILSRTFLTSTEGGRPLRIAGIATDITDRKEAEARIQHLNRVYAVLSGINSLIVRVQDRRQLLQESCRLAVEQGRFRFAWCGWTEPDGREFEHTGWAGDSDSMVRLLHQGLRQTDPGGSLVAAVMHSQCLRICDDVTNDPFLTPYRDEITSRGYQSIIALPLLVSGKSVGCLVLATDERGLFNEAEVRLLTELAGDISFAFDHIAKSERLNYLAYYDEVTGIANRAFFTERVSIYINNASRGMRKLALVVIQLDRFESMSETLGRAATDKLMREVASRFASSVGDTEVVARIAPGAFAAVLADIEKDTDVADLLGLWWPRWLGAAFHIEGNELLLTARAGIALYPEDGHNTDGLMRHAEAALKRAQQTGDPYLFYTQHLGERRPERLTLESRLRKGLENEEFLLHYQAKVDSETRRIKGVEALIRWNHPERGMVPPSEFISLMEETGIIIDVGAWVLRQACSDRAHWAELGLRAPRVAANVSTVQLRRKDFVPMMREILSAAGNHPGLDIEVTESLIMQDAEENIAKLVAIRDLGVNTAIDDFGTGYSSLGRLTKLPIAVLKVDRSFVSSMLEDPSAMTLVSTIISLAHALRLDVVAEGVESEEQAKILRLLRCDQMQGYLISRPVPFNEMTAFLGGNRI